MNHGQLACCISNNHCMMPDEFFWSYQRMFKPNGTYAVKGGLSVKSSSINMAIYKAMELGAEWMFLMDVDQTFQRDTIPRLWRAADKYNAKIISVLYHLGNAPFSPVAGWHRPGQDPECVNSNGELWHDFYAPLGKGVVEVDWAGAGGLMIHRDVIEAVGMPAFEDIWGEKRIKRSYGHDINFCLKAKEKGFKTYVDTDVCSNHGKFIYVSREYAEAFNKSDMLEQMGDSIKNQSFEAGYWDVVWETNHIRGYKRANTQTFIDVADMVNEGSLVADMGCGLGGLMEILKEKKNCKCKGYDFSEVSIEICKGKGFDGEVADFRLFQPNGESEKYDVVVATSLVEHLDKDIEFVGKMAQMCKPGGKVIITTPHVAEIQGSLEHIRGYDEEKINNLMKFHFKQYEVKKNFRDYLIVGVKG